VSRAALPARLAKSGSKVHLAPIDFGRTTWAVSPSLSRAHVQNSLPKSTEPERREERLSLCTPLPKGKDMRTGTVKFYNSQKGFGFIQPDDGGKDVFVHATALERAGMRGLVEGQKITFDVETDRRSGKPAASNLQAA
jgi:CspA family cold shock protein